VGIVDKLLEYVAMGGYVMPPLIAGTVLLWFGLGYRASATRRGRGHSPRVLVHMAREGRLIPGSVVEQAAVEGVRIVSSTVADVRRELTTCFVPLERELSRYRVVVRAVVAVAPLLGLLGTVSGMIETFASLGDMTLYSQSGGIAAGISQALLTTQFGLAVAIPGLVMEGMLAKREASALVQLDELKTILVGDGREVAA
jgi:biopolymer transport protein ExbB